MVGYEGSLRHSLPESIQSATEMVHEWWRGRASMMKEKEQEHLLVRRCG